MTPFIETIESIVSYHCNVFKTIFLGRNIGCFQTVKNSSISKFEVTITSNYNYYTTIMLSDIFK